MTKGKKRSKAASRKLQRGLMLCGAAVLLAVGLFLGIQIAKPPPPPDFARPVPDQGETPDASPRETLRPVAASEDLEEPPVLARQSPPERKGGRPRISLVIDDLGRSLEEIETLSRLEIPITYAVLPFESRTSEVVAELKRRGAEVLCHLPMEAKGGANPGPGALLSDMSPAELDSATRKALAAVPVAVGVNNHMGSGIASDRGAISTVMKVVAEKGLYFLDSRTSVDTQAFSVARQSGVPAAERQVFLDTTKDPTEIAAQFDRLLSLAERRGGAVAIAHPYRETLDVLSDKVPEAVARGFEFVTTSALLER